MIHEHTQYQGPLSSMRRWKKSVSSRKAMPTSASRLSSPATVPPQGDHLAR